MQEMQFRSLDWEERSEKETAACPCSCLGNRKDKGVWWAAVSVVSESQTQQGTHMVGIISDYE